MIGKTNTGAGGSGSKVYIDNNEIKAKEVNIFSNMDMAPRKIETSISAIKNSFAILDENTLIYIEGGKPASYDFNTKTTTYLSSSTVTFVSTDYNGNWYGVSGNKVIKNGEDFATMANITASRVSGSADKNGIICIGASTLYCIDTNNDTLINTTLSMSPTPTVMDSNGKYLVWVATYNSNISSIDLESNRLQTTITGKSEGGVGVIYEGDNIFGITYGWIQGGGYGRSIRGFNASTLTYLQSEYQCTLNSDFFTGSTSTPGINVYNWNSSSIYQPAVRRGGYIYTVNPNSWSGDGVLYRAGNPSEILLTN